MQTFTITRNGEDIEVAYDAIQIRYDGSDEVKVKFEFENKFGQKQSMHFSKAFSGSAADQLRDQIATAAQNAAKQEYEV